jgi:hypothetical protein
MTGVLTRNHMIISGAGAAGPAGSFLFITSKPFGIQPVFED